VLFCATERCALSCPHCYQVRDGAGGGGPELSLPEIETLLDELAGLGVFKFTITGGEPCLRPDLLDIVAAAWKRRFLIALKTSAVLLTKGDVAALRENGLSAMHVSLYHVDPDRHDAFVGRPGAWRATMDALETFHGLGGVAVVGTIAMSWNIDGITPLRELCEQRGWSLTVDPKINHRNDGGESPTRLRATGDDLVAAIRKLPKIKGQGPPRKADDLVCLAGVNTVYIKPDGEIWPCPVMPLSMGNIRETSLAEIWTDSPVRKRVLAMRWGDCAKCATCELGRFCQRCPGEAFQEHGDLARESAIDCAMAAAHARIWAEAHPDD
jgi:radical SAM protein with 4Fe4S-binding SPASM domain